MPPVEVLLSPMPLGARTQLMRWQQSDIRCNECHAEVCCAGRLVLSPCSSPAPTTFQEADPSCSMCHSMRPRAAAAAASRVFMGRRSLVREALQDCWEDASRSLHPRAQQQEEVDEDQQLQALLARRQLQRHQQQCKQQCHTQTLTHRGHMRSCGCTFCRSISSSSRAAELQRLLQELEGVCEEFVAMQGCEAAASQRNSAAEGGSKPPWRP